MRKYIDGFLRDNSKIGLVDDLITTADSKIEALKLVMDEKERLGLGQVKITDVYILLDREQGGPETLNKYGIKTHNKIMRFPSS